MDSRVVISGDHIHESIDTCIDWAKNWLMELNLSKCKVFWMGRNNENRDYMMQGVILESVTQEKDLGVVIDMGGKQVAQCQAAIGRANLGFRLYSEGDQLYIKRWC